MVLIFPSIVSICSGWPRHISPNGLNWKNYTKKYLKGAYTIDPGILQPVVPGSFYFFWIVQFQCHLKAALIHFTLFGVHLHILEHEWVIAEPQGLAAGSGHIPENDFPGSDIGKLLLVGIVGHLWIEI